MACQWKNSSAEMISYHDKEWGVPTHEDQKLFEYLLLESMQAVMKQFGKRILLSFRRNR